MNKTIYNYKPKIKTEYGNKNRVVSFLNEIRKSVLGLYTYHETILSRMRNISLKD